MPFNKRKEDTQNNWTFIDPSIWTQELLLSNDGKYIFECKFYARLLLCRL